MGVPGSDPFEKDVFPVKFVPSLQGFPGSKALRQRLGAGQSGGGVGSGVGGFISPKSRSSLWKEKPFLSVLSGAPSYLCGRE